MTQQNNLALKKLKGIKPKGVKTKPSYESNLEYLISSGLECVELFGNMLNERGLAFDNVYQTSDKVYEYVDSMNLFSESDLKNLIYNLSVSDLLESYKPKTIFGMYSGALLSKLTKSNQEKGLPTKIHIDGNNQKFDNLFMYAKHVDELVVENFEGGNICREIGSKGTINSLIVRNIKGNCTCLQAAKKGFANFIYVENIEGSNCCQNSAGEGHINLILGTNIEGGNALDKISQKPDSHVEIIIGVNISGSSALSSVASYKGSAGLVLAKNMHKRIYPYIVRLYSYLRGKVSAR